MKKTLLILVIVVVAAGAAAAVVPVASKEKSLGEQLREQSDRFLWDVCRAEADSYVTTVVNALVKQMRERKSNMVTFYFPVAKLDCADMPADNGRLARHVFDTLCGADYNLLVVTNTTGLFRATDGAHDADGRAMLVFPFGVVARVTEELRRPPCACAFESATVLKERGAALPEPVAPSVAPVPVPGAHS